MEENELIPVDNNPVEYTDDNIRHLSDMEHVRDRKSTRLNSSHIQKSRMPSSA